MSIHKFGINASLIVERAKGQIRREGVDVVQTKSGEIIREQRKGPCYKSITIFQMSNLCSFNREKVNFRRCRVDTAKKRISAQRITIGTRIGKGQLLLISNCTFFAPLRTILLLNKATFIFPSIDLDFRIHFTKEPL